MEKRTLEETRKKMLVFVDMARKKDYSTMDIVDCIFAEFIFGYAQTLMDKSYKDGEQNVLRELKLGKYKDKHYIADKFGMIIIKELEESQVIDFEHYQKVKRKDDNLLKEKGK